MRHVGSTQQQLRIRLQEHRSRIKHQVMEAPLTQHCLENNHDFNKFQCNVLEVIATSAGVHFNSHRRLLQREFFWITRLKTLTPLGLNQEVDYSMFI